MNLLAITDFPSMVVDTFPYHYSTNLISLISCKIHCLCLPISYLVYVLIHLEFFENH